MELNDRPALETPTGSGAPDLLFTTLILLLIFLPLWFFGGVRTIVCLGLNLAGGAIVVLIAIGQWSDERPDRHSNYRYLAVLTVLVLTGFAFWHLSFLSRQPVAFVIALGLPLFAIVLLAYLVSRQFAFWATANPLVEWHESRRWRSVWRKILFGPLPAECPEALTCRLALTVLLAQFWLGYEVADYSGVFASGVDSHSSAGLLSILVVFLPLPLYWLAWNLSGVVPRTTIGATFDATSRAFHVCFSYPPKDAGAPGMFRFPDKGMRSGGGNWLAALAVGMLILAPLPLIDPEGEASVLVWLRQITSLFPAFVGHDSPLALTLAGIMAILAPPMLIFWLTWFIMGSVLARYYQALDAPGASNQSHDKSAWAISVDRILNSRDSLERQHVLLGRSIFGDYPILLHRELLHQHAHLVGDSGSRKTSLGIAPLIAQLIAGQDCSVVVLDLKGDRALFETARLEANCSRADFRWFTSEIGQSSHVFNPFEQSHFQRMTPNQQTQLVLEGLSLDYGDAYGRGFFSAMNETVLLNILRTFEVHSFKQLHELLIDKHANLLAGNPENLKDARHLIALVARLASISPINVTKADLAQRPQARDARIDMGDAMSRSQVIYFNLRSPAEPIGSPAVAKMAMYALFSSAAQRLPTQTHRVYIIIDEFQQIVSENVRLVLEQARSSKLSFIIAHQALGQLDRKGVDVRDTVSACTAFKQIFRVSDPETLRYVESMSGEAGFETLSWQQQVDPYADTNADAAFSPKDAHGGMVLVNETIGSRLEKNTIMDISASPNTSLFAVTEGSGYTQFSGYMTPIVSEYHISMKEYGKRNDAPWPAPSEETVVVEPPPSRRRTSGSPAPSIPNESAPSAPPSAETWEHRLRGIADAGDSPETI